MTTTRDLARRLVSQRPQRKLTRHRGKITATSTNTVSLYLDGNESVELTGIRYFDHYTPSVDDIVEILIDGTDILVLGKLA